MDIFDIPYHSPEITTQRKKHHGRPVRHRPGLRLLVCGIINVSSMNLEYGKLCIQSALYMDARLFREHAISGNCPKHVYYEILKTPVP